MNKTSIALEIESPFIIVERRRVLRVRMPLHPFLRHALCFWVRLTQLTFYNRPDSRLHDFATTPRGNSLVDFRGRLSNYHRYQYLFIPLKMQTVCLFCPLRSCCTPLYTCRLLLAPKFSCPFLPFSQQSLQHAHFVHHRVTITNAPTESYKGYSCPN